MLSNQRVFGFDDREVAWSHIMTRSRSEGLGLESSNHLEGVIDDLVNRKGAGNHVPGSAAVINDNQGLSRDTFLGIEDTILL